jgi:hypothetical protein
MVSRAINKKPRAHHQKKHKLLLLVTAMQGVVHVHFKETEQSV